MFKNKISLIIPIAGNGSRMNSDKTKQLIKLDGEMIFIHTLNKFINEKFIYKIILVCKENEIDTINQIVASKYCTSKVEIVVGGKTRQESVYNGLLKLENDTDVVIVHDGARPFVSSKMVEITREFSEKLAGNKIEDIDGGIFAVAVKETIKKIEKFIVKNIPREDLYLAQTPQIFRYDKLLEGNNYCRKNNLSVTDDSMIIEKNGGNVIVLDGEYYNIKITSPDDLIFGKEILKEYFGG